MSDIDPDLPDYLVDAILSEGPPQEAVDLVKNAFTWRTVDAELMELAYDSVLDVAGVRDASTVRTIEFSIHDLSIVVEVGPGSVTGQISPARAGVVVLRGRDEAIEGSVDTSGGFGFVDQASGPRSLTFIFGDQRLTTPTFALGS